MSPRRAHRWDGGLRCVDCYAIRAVKWRQTHAVSMDEGRTWRPLHRARCPGPPARALAAAAARATP